VSEREGETAAGAGDVETVLWQLMEIDSQNPDLVPGAAGERPLAETVAALLDKAGLQTSIHEVVDGRPNVLGVLPGTAGAPTIVLEAHLDTVPAPEGGLPLRQDGRRLYGRGACDTKGSLAAMIVAAERLAAVDGPRPTVVVAGVADEEYIMRGAAALVEQLRDVVQTVTGVVIGEPTSLIPVRAHNGFIRVRLQVQGTSAHSSKAHLGVNAIIEAARAITVLDEQLGERLRRHPHLLTGPALLSPTMITGGIAPNVVPDRVEVMFDRRLSPEETVEGALDEIEAVLAALRGSGMRVSLDQPVVGLPGFSTPATDLMVAAAQQAAAQVTGVEEEASGVTYSTDACYLNGVGGLPCVVMGPGSIDQAHTDDEWIDLDEVVAAVEVYTALALNMASRSGAAA
jgi:acetylornithine deacetylase